MGPTNLTVLNIVIKSIRRDKNTPQVKFYDKSTNLSFIYGLFWVIGKFFCFVSPKVRFMHFVLLVITIMTCAKCLRSKDSLFLDFYFFLVETLFLCTSPVKIWQNRVNTPLIEKFVFKVYYYYKGHLNDILKVPQNLLMGRWF